MKYNVLCNSYEKVGGIVNNVAIGVREFIPDFQVSDFISAHFLLSPAEFYGNLVLSAMVISGAFLLYLRNSQRI